MSTPSISRREQILATAAAMFARHGFNGVSIAELGAACGISGPALYKHFRSKDEILAALLVDISDSLLSEARARVAAADSPEQAMRSLLEFHISFATQHPELIVIQDRDWESLPDGSRDKVRSVQREYVAIWAGQIAQLRRVRPSDLGVADLAAARAVAHALFGLLNSTPRGGILSQEEAGSLLLGLGLRALGLPEKLAEELPEQP